MVQEAAPISNNESFEEALSELMRKEPGYQVRLHHLSGYIQY
jgi:hypothetical protein